MDYMSTICECFETLIRLFVASIVAYIVIPAKWKNEYRVHLILQILTGEEFVSTRDLSWLVNPITGRRLEIDSYCEKLSLCVETNGIQHYKKTSRFSQDLEYRVFLDLLKEKLCYENEKTLLIIPYTIPPTSLCSYIVGKLELISILQSRYL